MRLFKRTTPPGTAPGTLPAVAPPSPGRVRLVRFSRDHLAELELERMVDAAGSDLVGSGDDDDRREVRWLDLVGHDAPLIGRIGERLRLHPLGLEDVVNTGQRPKTDDFGNALFVVLDLFAFGAGDEGLEREQVSLVLQEGLVLSVRERESAVFEPVRERLRADGSRLRSLPADYLAYALVDAVVDQLFPVLEQLGERIEDAEEGIMEEPDPGDLNALHVLRRDLLLLRKSTWPLREVVGRLQRSDSTLIHDETRLYLRDVGDHVALCVDIIETYREMVASLTELYLSAVSNRLNEVMKVLTIIATIFIPLSFIAGVYGMNFDRNAGPLNMPELGWAWGYPFSILLMALTAGALLLFFRRRGWV
jgi:magnesium transporter